MFATNKFSVFFFSRWHTVQKIGVTHDRRLAMSTPPDTIEMGFQDRNPTTQNSPKQQTSSGNKKQTVSVRRRVCAVARYAMS
jgi:hypothetical protein